MDIKPGIIIIKSPDVLRAMLEQRYAPLLIQILMGVVSDYGAVITSAYRAGDKGVHGHRRGIDLRSWCYYKETARRIVGQINAVWMYDPERLNKKCAMIHKVKNGAEHIHLQVHPHTRRR